jgi:putative DNA primase/helicase
MAGPAVEDKNGTAASGGQASTPLDAALAYLRAGLSVVPIKADGSKRPPIPWKEFESRLATEAELREWYGNGKGWGVGIVAGKVSGNLEHLDFDKEATEVFKAWSGGVEAECPGLVGRLSVRLTPTDGYHVSYRCTEIEVPGNTKLAQKPNPEDPSKPLVLIETRGEGGQCVVPGSPAHCHETGRRYRHASGPKLSQVQTITAAEREVLIRCARSFDRCGQEDAAEGIWKQQATDHPTGLRPGDDYNQRGPDWPEILAGWTLDRQSGGVRHWKRPGKDGPGSSATTEYCAGKNGEPLLAMFSTNGHPFEGPKNGKQCSCYSKFSAYALIHHGGDFKAAAKALAAEGYGDRPARGAGQESTAKGFSLGALTLVPGPAHRTPTRLLVPLAVFRGGCQVDTLTLGQSTNARREASRLLQPHLGDLPPTAEETARVFSAILAAADTALRTPDAPAGPALAQIVRAKVTQALQLRFRTDKGALWSEAHRREIDRNQLLAFTPNWLLEAAEGAGDAPRAANAAAERAGLLDAVRRELQVLYADLMGTLPVAAAAGLEPGSAAAEIFRGAMRRLWHAPITNERVVLENGDAIILGGSLVTRARGRICKGENLDPDAVKGWEMLHSPYCAWWRPWASPDGEILPRLAMRWELTAQAKVELPGVSNLATLREVGAAFGVIDPNPDPGLPVRKSGGGRLAVLAVDFARELLDDPAVDEPTAPEPSASDTETASHSGCQ